MAPTFFPPVSQQIDVLAGATRDAALVLGIRILVRLPHAVREGREFQESARWCEWGLACCATVGNEKAPLHAFCNWGPKRLKRKNCLDKDGAIIGVLKFMSAIESDEEVKSLKGICGRDELKNCQS